MYANLLHSPLVSKAVAIDFHPYHNPSGATDWLVNFMAGPPPSGYATKLYYSCASNWYWLEQITYGATTFQAQAGLPPITSAEATPTMARPTTFLHGRMPALAITSSCSSPALRSPLCRLLASAMALACLSLARTPSCS